MLKLSLYQKKYIHFFVFVIGMLPLLFSGSRQPAVYNCILFQDSTSFHPQYYLLQKALHGYDSILKSGGWNFLDQTKSYQYYSKEYSITKHLRKRLELEGYLVKRNSINQDTSDADLFTALKIFQTNNGLVAAGNLNTATLAALNISSEKRIEQIKINMERWKALPKFLGKDYLFVNSAYFNLDVIENSIKIIKMKIIVGQIYRRTPVFSEKLTHVIFNPTWHIPTTIREKDILPIVIKDTSYLRKKFIKIYKTDVNGIRREVATDLIDWKSVTAKKFPYDLVQTSGSKNALGAVKFIFPNSYNVYMHDTPSKELFNKTEPTFSSGCIRLSKAIELSEHLLKNKKGWSKEKINKTIKSGKTMSVYLQEPVPVYIQYYTAWVNESGILQFRKDIYNRD